MKVKISKISPNEASSQKERKGFISVCCYGDMKPEENEIGGIFKEDKESNPRLENGVWVTRYECVERIFVKDCQE